MPITGARRVGAAGRRTLRDPWLLPVVATPMVGIAMVTDEHPAHRAVSILLAVVFLGGATMGIARERLRSGVGEMLFESVVATTAVVFVASGLGLVVDWPGTTALPTLVTMIAVACAVLALLCCAWLVSIDRGSRTVSTAFLAAAVSACGMAAMLQAESVRPQDAPTWAVDVSLLATIVGIVGATVHPGRAQLRSPTAHLQRSHVARRAALMLGVILSGPMLVTMPFTVETMPMPLVVGASAGLTLLAVVHVYGLLRRWGELEHEVYHDDLTGLPNRQYFNQRLRLAIEHARYEGHELAVLFLDLDNFKQVNDTLGHAAGNELLVAVAARVRDALGEQRTFARLGGDEFAVLVPFESGSDAQQDTTRRILDAFATPFEVASRLVWISPSIGAARYPTDGLDASSLLERADHAMYRAKARRREAREQSAGRALPLEPTREIEAALRRAINDERLVLHYQPKVDMRSGRVAAVEALLRWRHPSGGLLLPESFLPIAEDNGMMAPLAEWVLLEACALGRRWLDSGAPAVRVAVNLSASQLHDRRIPELVERVLRFTKLPAELLEIEVDARAFRRGHRGVVGDLAELHALGVRCVIDDVGSMGDLDSIDEVEIAGIEIHRRHVAAIATGGRVASAFLAMGNALGVDTVAEGIETPEQLAYVLDHGCHVAQGHLFARPAPSDEILHLLDLEFDAHGNTVPATPSASA
ncbi:MAG TPA: EAL domain-containing protein [Acidimicrobiales bacterium]